MAVKQLKAKWLSVGKGVSGDFAYPFGSMAACMILIYLAPFTSLLLNYLAFGLCLYRVVRYDESVFAVDYCALAAVSYIFLSTGRVSLLAWLSIVAALWYAAKGALRKNASLILLVILLDYMLLRMQMELNKLVLCFSPLALMYVLVLRQKRQGIVPCSLAFCGSVVLSSAYAFVLRGAPQLRSLLGGEYAAYWGSSLMRFQGLLRDPNYYMTMVVVAITLIVLLYVNGHVSKKALVPVAGVLVLFGALTYSKTFVVVLAVTSVMVVAFLFYQKRFLLGVVSVLVVLAAAVVLSDTVLSVTVYRIASADNLYDLTTGRSELIINYLGEITKSITSLLFGEGLSAELLRRGTHNLFLEVIYYFGLVGLALAVAYMASLLRSLKQRFAGDGADEKGVFRYAVLAIFLLLFCTLQGMTFPITYVMLYLALLSTVMPAKSAALSTDGEV